ncbi:hypothetical protein HHL08_22390 [Sphingobium sp. AR-3-1]|uniref:Glycosyl transferase family 28 C-terminal domain-containing protein n=2 Tax=Sphingobium psychrophilum TaxID=2728834 RepID=A0A7X9ZUK3_9SPHN|nr:hypothetical protein [Sphingobium psychrophilum]
MPFDRMVRAVDEWAGENPNEEVFIQIGGGDYLPRHADFDRMVEGADYRARLQASDLFVAHVGMGSILQALELEKQMLLLPRIAAKGEHTTEHQRDTAKRFAGRRGLMIVEHTDALKEKMTHLLREPLQTGGVFSSKASPELVRAVAGFLQDGRDPD